MNNTSSDRASLRNDTSWDRKRKGHPVGMAFCVCQVNYLLRGLDAGGLGVIFVELGDLDLFGQA
jgi:hypothetical protein